MADERFSRAALLIGAEGQARLARSHAAVFGLGGVGSWAAEALARAGIGRLTLIDFDVIEESNINRQILALESTLGRLKTEVMKDRVLDINPEASVQIISKKYLPENRDLFFEGGYDYALDAIDMVSAKIDLIETCAAKNIPLISSMGTGGKLDPSRFEVADIYQTDICPLAKVMRKELRKRGIEKLRVVFSREEPQARGSRNAASGKCLPPGSISFVPSSAGLLMASVVVRGLLGKDST